MTLPQLAGGECMQQEGKAMSLQKAIHKRVVIHCGTASPMLFSTKIP